MLLDLLFPQHCLGCGIRDSALCENCIPYLRPAERENKKDIYSAYDYRDPIIKKAIWNLKYHKQHSLGNILGRLLYEANLEEIADIKIFTGGTKIYIIPVPMSMHKQKERGYNQTEKLARGFCKNDTSLFELHTNIIKKKDTILPQARIHNRNKRLQNIKGAFTVIKPGTINGKTIIVIDDVTTTGGTMSEILKVLYEAGAKKVIGFTLAH